MFISQFIFNNIFIPFVSLFKCLLHASTLVNCARIDQLKVTLVRSYSAMDWVILVKECLDCLGNWRRLFLHPISLSQRSYPQSDLQLCLEMRSWYDIPSLQPGTESITQQQDKDGILKSRDQIIALIKHEKVPPNRILLGGFSQGGALALATGLSE